MSVQELDNLVKTGSLKAEPPAKAEFDGLLASGRAKLRDSEVKSLSLESRFDLSYNAAHAFSLAALRWHGYRSENRFTVFQCLVHTLKLGTAQARILSDAHGQRNRAEYEGMLDLSQGSVEAIIRIVKEIADRVQKLGPIKAPVQGKK